METIPAGLFIQIIFIIGQVGFFVLLGLNIIFGKH